MMSFTRFFQVLICFAACFFNVSAQNPDFDQFYYSNAEPYEINRDPIDHLDSLLEVTKVLSSENFDHEDFVYKHSYYLNRLNRSGNVFYRDSISQYLNRLKDIILPNDSLIKVYLVDFPSMNAFTNDFGNIYIHVGALVKLEREEELLFMLAHEISHVLLRHSYNTELKQNEWNLDEDFNLFDRHRFSRLNEFEADSMALELISNKVSARYLKELFERLDVSQNPIQVEPTFDYRTSFPLKHPEVTSYITSNWPEYKAPRDLDEDIGDSLSTHPAISKRIAKTEQFIEKNGTTESLTSDNSKFLHW